MANIVSTTIDGQPFFLQKETGEANPIYYSARDMRKAIAGIITRPGALTLGAFSVAQSANVGMSIKVNSGYYMVGDYLCYLPTDQTIDLSGFASNPPATRTHRVYLSVYDALMGGTQYAHKIDVVEDQGSGAGVPNLASSFTQVATISVAKGQSNIQNAQITDTRARGGMQSDYFFLYGSLDSAYDAAGADIGTSNFRAQLANGSVRLAGSIKKTNGADFAAGTYQIGTLTSNLQPPRNRFLIGATEGTTQTWRLQIRPDGTMTANVGTSTKYLMFDGMQYELD